MTYNQWVKFHELVVKYVGEDIVTLSFKTVHKDRPSPHSIATKPDCLRSCYMRAMRDGVILNSMPEWAQVIWDQVQT